MDGDESKKAAYRRCKLKKFPQIFTFKGNKYIIEAKHEKYLKMPVNPIFITMDNHLTPLPLDSYANVIKLKNKKQQQMFSKILSQMNPKEKESRTLSLST